MLNWITAGESHGEKLVVLISGMVSNLEIPKTLIEEELARRRLGFGRGSRMLFEKDLINIFSGVRNNKTLAGPIGIEILNSEWSKWKDVMSSDEIPSILSTKRNERLLNPRPGHADLSGVIKYNFEDIRNTLERASARETAARVAAGAIAKKFLQDIADIQIISHTKSIGSVTSDSTEIPSFENLKQIDFDVVRAFNKNDSKRFEEEIIKAKKEGDTLGGSFEVIAFNVPIGLGSFSQSIERLDSKISGSFMSIPSVKGVEIGSGIKSSKQKGSMVQDSFKKDEKTKKYKRISNNAGGIEGGVSNGNPIVIHAFMKPISTIPNSLPSFNLLTGEESTSINQRSDIVAVPAGGVVGESSLALVLANEILTKFGGDSLKETKNNYKSYIQMLKKDYPWIFDDE